MEDEKVKFDGKYNYFKWPGLQWLNPMIDSYINNTANEIFEGLTLEEARRLLYRNLRPYNYGNAFQIKNRLEKTIKNNES